MLAQSSCTPKLLKEYAGSPRTFYEKDTAELKLDIDSVWGTERSVYESVG